MKFTYYYTKDNQQGFSRLSNWFPLWCLGHEWAICPWYDDPLLGLGFWLSFAVKILYGEEGLFFWFFAPVHVLYITKVLPIVFPLKLIYSQIAFYTEYFVLTFSIDVVSILANRFICGGTQSIV